MGALPNTLPQPSRKPAGKAGRPAGKLNKFGRDSATASERMRVSDYDAKNFAPSCPLPFSFFADLPRLTSGKADTWLVLAVWAKSAGRGEAPESPKRKADFWEGVEPGKRPEWSLSLPVGDWAQVCRCSERQIEREFDNLQKRGIIAYEKTGPGRYRARLLYRDWEKLPDYNSGVIEMPAGDDSAAELEDEDEAKPGNQRVTGRKPLRVPAGKSSKPLPVTVGVREYQVQVKGPVDCEVSGVIQAGRFVTVIEFPEDWRQKVLKSASVSNETNKLDDNFRHGRRKTEPVKHPRAGELVALFDPFLARSGAVLLSMDSRSLLAACMAAEDCDHDYLVKFAAQRAASPIRKPGHVLMICREAVASWKQSKGVELPAERGQKKGFADRLKAEAERRLRKYGRI